MICSMFRGTVSIPDGTQRGFLVTASVLSLRNDGFICLVMRLI